MAQNDKTKKPDIASNSEETVVDISALQDKWGVSAEEIFAAIKQVSNDRSSIEEYLVNNKWQRTERDPDTFQKRDLNEDETY